MASEDEELYTYVG